MSAPGLRTLAFLEERVLADGAGRGLAAPIRRVAALAVAANPLAGRAAEDLSALFDLGRDLGRLLAGEAVARLGGPAVAYGKGALVGAEGEMEHGAAMIHPKLGAPLRAAVGGGAALIPSNCRLAALGGTLDLPLGHKDEAWSFDHFDTMTVGLADAPRPGEVVLIVGVADGGRAHPRAGSGPLAD